MIGPLRRSTCYAAPEYVASSSHNAVSLQQDLLLNLDVRRVYEYTRRTSPSQFGTQYHTRSQFLLDQRNLLSDLIKIIHCEHLLHAVTRPRSVLCVKCQNESNR